MAGVAFEKKILSDDEFIHALKNRLGKRIVNGNVEK